jgi:hypothetical protein
MSPDGGEPPVPVRGAMVLSTPSCVSIGCCPEIDGETEIRLGPIDEVGLDRLPDFSGTIETPNRILVISTVERDSVLEATVPKPNTRLLIWLSHPRWPDKVIVGFE